jgi:hypothetical protein
MYAKLVDLFTKELDLALQLINALDEVHIPVGRQAQMQAYLVRQKWLFFKGVRLHDASNNVL